MDSPEPPALPETLLVGFLIGPVPFSDILSADANFTLLAEREFVALVISDGDLDALTDPYGPRNP